MKTQIVAISLAVLVLAGCSSRYNPVNWSWFGGSRSEASLAPRGGFPSDVDPRPLVSQVVSMQVDRVPEGAVVTAVGLPPTQGWWAAGLVSRYESEAGRIAAKDGVIELEFRILPPAKPQNVINEASREVSAGIYLSNQTLAGVRRITVIGQNNQRTSNR
ncbi:hypothetical protein [Tropicimonas sp. IMCC6043]|uniref:hypothetical protein n=1 Tax=Tropicimonas sp. IMCC6043 TaxID=2510645 RepID=UPI00101B8429|nr:hypothetical protein [Tropicimonas sp. IMCC6043]RYH10380.1 hypothetical protein EU800_08830 [Tropicimonas sp. IMCC6043]